MLYGILLDTKPVPLTGFQDRQPHLIVELWISVWYGSWFQVVYHPSGSGIGLISYPFWSLLELWTWILNNSDNSKGGKGNPACAACTSIYCTTFMIRSWLACLSSCGKMDTWGGCGTKSSTFRGCEWCRLGWPSVKLSIRYILDIFKVIETLKDVFFSATQQNCLERIMLYNYVQVAKHDLIKP